MDMEIDGPKLEVHGLHCGVPAPCRRQSSKGIITCTACIDVEQRDILSMFEPGDRGICLDIIEKLDKAGRQGLGYDFLAVSPFSSQHHVTEQGFIKQTDHMRNIQTMIRRLTSSKYALCYWVGYAYPVLVSRRHIRDWTVSLPGPHLQLIFPRRWLNIKGGLIEDVWNAGLGAVAGVLVNRPGISQVPLSRTVSLLVFIRSS